ncbi:hypothetical protein HY404_00265 [Candidatus Microgenomates bacterium]|nr:hypothetical protein [Candidatus Microgenomates bacterium]
MRNQKGLAPILILLLIVLAVGGAYWFSKQPAINHQEHEKLTYEEAEKFIVNCKVYSIGQSHVGITEGYFSLGVKDVDGKDYKFFKVDKDYRSQIYKKISEVTLSGKCPKVDVWIE